MVMTMRSTWLALVLLIGCGGEEATPAPEPQPEAAPVVEAEPGARVVDPTYELVATASGPYSSGEQGTFEIRLLPRGEHHVNVEYPFAIALAGPEPVRFAEASLDAEDAAELNEQRARFAVPFTPDAAGEHRVTATVDFAVCTPSTCIPEQRTLALVLPVQ